MESTAHLPLPKIDRNEMEAFCAPYANRFECLCKSLERRKIHYEVIPLGESRHIFLPLPHQNRLSLDAEYYRVTLVAHYDRVQGTPGANDNAAAVFQLLSHWEDMTQMGWHHRTQVVFTDKEELTGEMRAVDQGSRLLAQHLQRLGAKNILFFVLDMCGIGDTPVWGRSMQKAGLHTFSDPVTKAHQVMERFLKKYTGGANFGVNPMFSDDLGLLLGGYPALQLSLLPRNQALDLSIGFKEWNSELISKAPARYREMLYKDLPTSWKSNHGPNDNLESLEPRAFRLMRILLRGLARYRFELS